MNNFVDIVDNAEIEFAKDGSAWGSLADILSALYPTADSLARPLRVYLSVNLDAVVGQDAQQVHFKLVEWAASAGNLLKLVAIVLAENKDTSVVRVFARKYPRYATLAGQLLERGDVTRDDALAQLCDGLLSAYSDYDALSRLTLTLLNENLAQRAGSSAIPLKDVVLRLVKWTESQGRLTDLLTGAVQQAPGNTALRALGIAVTATLPPKTPPDGLESALRQDAAISGSTFHTPSVWRERMARAERAVCRLDDAAGRGIGSGFLIAPDVVLTNWHVVSDASTTNAAATSGWNAVFTDGSIVPFADIWRLADSPVKELDYCAVRLGTPIGEEKLADGQRRGCLALTQSPAGWMDMRELKGEGPELDEAVLILQHPGGGDLKVSAGVVTAVDSLHQRITYNAATAPGSSGSPCFTMNWDLLGLHHHGQRQGNHGIAIRDIRRSLRDKGVIS